MNQDADGNLVPGVALSFEASDDKMTYTFNLRQDAKWSNGDPVTDTTDDPDDPTDFDNNGYAEPDDPTVTPLNQLPELQVSKVDGAIDLGIDGNIYLLHNTGQLVKYYGGELEAMTLAAADPEGEEHTPFFDEDALDVFPVDQAEKKLPCSVDIC